MTTDAAIEIRHLTEVAGRWLADSRTSTRLPLTLGPDAPAPWLLDPSVL
jgi:hypothetical protein